MLGIKFPSYLLSIVYFNRIRTIILMKKSLEKKVRQSYVSIDNMLLMQFINMVYSSANLEDTRKLIFVFITQKNRNNQCNNRIGQKLHNYKFNRY